MFLYENLDPETFQRFVQALFVKQYPDLQCFPVGQPDGGRDALDRTSSAEQPATVLQVKFKRKEDGDGPDWLLDAMKRELPRIQDLVAKGMTRYRVITNASGTGHPDVGRIDRLQDWLRENVAIPDVMCIWRDDLDARLASSNADGVKLAFPALLTGSDTLTLLVQALFTPEQLRIDRAIRAFVAEQYRQDEKVKFRQVDLSNALSELFVDVPARVDQLLQGSKRIAQTGRLRTLVRRYRNEIVEARANRGTEYEITMWSNSRVGTATLLLDSELQPSLSRVLLQGGPGQGKSTLAQFVCQVHRAAYLGREEFLHLAEENYQIPPLRIPIRVDLREFGNYLERRPIGASDHTPSTDAPLSLEGFLAAYISIDSGGLAFSVDDLIVASQKLPILLFLDGLDEIADLKLRRRLVDEINRGIGRLAEMQPDLQVVVTTRPSLFGQTPTLRGGFRTLQLADIDRNLILEYSNKWLVARALEAPVVRDVKDILREKLATPHVSELTRNPMQLAIFLNLIHTMGRSIPDVRTDLYRRYVELFMMREAEKDEVVRAHRDLLIEVVEVLAWNLQVEAESHGGAGRIGAKELEALVETYLRDGQHDVTLAHRLFSRGLERIYVLVARIEGLYEFEVQSLREYFAAQFLYHTAPVGSFRNIEPRGDRAQRFEALAVNPYWANVVRFYAGSYASGELSALALSLKELIRSPNQAQSIVVRGIGAALLTDWAFKTKPFAQSEVIDLVFDGLGIELSAEELLPGFEKRRLPKQCGQPKLAQKIFSDYFNSSDKQPTDVLATFLLLNGGPTLVTETRGWIDEVTGASRTERLRLGALFGALDDSSAAEIGAHLKADDPSAVELATRVLALVRDGDVVAHSADLERLALEHVLKWGGTDSANPSRPVNALSVYLTGALRFPYRRRLNDGSDEESSIPEITALLARLDSREAESANGPAHEASEAGLENLLRECVKEFGEQWAFYRLAIHAADVMPLHPITGSKAAPPHHESPLSRAVLARSWRGRRSWWTEQYEYAASEVERLFVLGLLLAWAPSKYVLELMTEVDLWVSALSDEDLFRLAIILEEAHASRRAKGGATRKMKVPESGVSDRTRDILEVALGIKESSAPWYLLSPATYRLRSERLGQLEGFPGWIDQSDEAADVWLGRIAEFDLSGGYLYGGRASAIYGAPLSEYVIRRVLEAPRLYPGSLIQAALNARMKRYKPVGLKQVADAQGWTFD